MTFSKRQAWLVGIIGAVVFLVTWQSSASYGAGRGVFWKEADARDALRVPLPAFSELAKAVTPTVVNISTSRKYTGKDALKGITPPPGYEEWYDEFFKRFFDKIPEQEFQQKSLGSGFIISADGYVLTNNHVIAGADEIVVSLADKEEFKATVVGTDDKTDIALLKIHPAGKKKEFPVAVLGDSDALEIGEWVVAIGNPFGFGHTLTQGIVSAKSRVIGAGPYDNFIQTDAAINPGNSGGPLINMRGQVVGINTAIVASGQGIGFATPINMVKEILPELKDTGEVARGWLGVAIQEVTPEMARAVGLDKPRGAMVSTVYPGDPAHKAGIKPGDVILAVNGHDVEDPRALTRMIGGLKPGSMVKLSVFREGKMLELQARLEKRVDEKVARADRREKRFEGVKDEVLGLVVTDITPEVQKEYDLPDNQGILVLDVDTKGPSSRGQIQKMDVIKEVDRKEIRSVEQYKAALSAKKKGQSVLLLIQRGSSPLYVAFDIE